ncbi:hypothetical protein F5Y08DRAFT_3827 [Xylaria arbuscula]|nr:hypothetical protein F5Y08DRAFT_3827 [Xylaria arbuscula]
MSLPLASWVTQSSQSRRYLSQYLKLCTPLKRAIKPPALIPFHSFLSLFPASPTCFNVIPFLTSSPCTRYWQRANLISHAIIITRFAVSLHNTSTKRHGHHRGALVILVFIRAATAKLAKLVEAGCYSILQPKEKISSDSVVICIPNCATSQLLTMQVSSTARSAPIFLGLRRSFVQGRKSHFGGFGGRGPSSHHSSHSSRTFVAIPLSSHTRLTTAFFH